MKGIKRHQFHDILCPDLCPLLILIFFDLNENIFRFYLKMINLDVSKNCYISNKNVTLKWRNTLSDVSNVINIYKVYKK